MRPEHSVTKAKTETKRCETETKNYETKTKTETTPVKLIACESNTNR